MTVEQNSNMFFLNCWEEQQTFFFLTSARFSKEDTLMLFSVVFVYVFALMYSFLCRRGKRDDAGQYLFPLFCVFRTLIISYTIMELCFLFFVMIVMISFFFIFAFCPFFPSKLSASWTALPSLFSPYVMLCFFSSSFFFFSSWLLFTFMCFFFLPEILLG